MQRHAAYCGSDSKSCDKRIAKTHSDELCGVNAGRAPEPYLQPSFGAARGEGISDFLNTSLRILQEQTVSALKTQKMEVIFYENKIKENL